MSKSYGNDSRAQSCGQAFLEFCDHLDCYPSKHALSFIVPMASSIYPSGLMKSWKINIKIQLPRLLGRAEELLAWPHPCMRDSQSHRYNFQK
jgi:hypothetical protein